MTIPSSILVWLYSLISLSSPSTSIVTLTTNAFDITKGILLYTEIRMQMDRNGIPGEWNFEYRDQNGILIVTRNVNFTANALRPSFELKDLRNGYLEGAEVVPNGIRVYSGGSADDPFREKTLQVPEPAIVDAGFNYYIAQHFNRLIQGEKLTFNFVAPSQLDYFGFRMYMDKQMQYKGRSAVLIKMDIDNFFLRLFVDPIKLIYDTQTRSLVMYEGISNIYNEEGKSYKVRMEFAAP